MTFTASDVLLKAASRIEEEGMWCKGFWFDVNGLTEDQSGVVLNQGTETMTVGNMAVAMNALGVRAPHCAEGAMASAVIDLLGRFDSALYWEADVKLMEFVQDDVPSWNDHRASAFEVAEAMRNAAL